MMTKRSLYYTIDDAGEPVEVDLDDPRAMKAMVDWEPGKRRVARDVVGDWTISTVFLMVDHSCGCGKPVLWETMIFGPEPFDDWCERYTSRADAVAGHTRAIEMVKHGCEQARDPV